MRSIQVLLFLLLQATPPALGALRGIRDDEVVRTTNDGRRTKNNANDVLKAENDYDQTQDEEDPYFVPPDDDDNPYTGVGRGYAKTQKSGDDDDDDDGKGSAGNYNVGATKGSGDDDDDYDGKGAKGAADDTYDSKGAKGAVHDTYDGKGAKGYGDDTYDGKGSDGKGSDGKGSDGKGSDGKGSDGKGSGGKGSDGKGSDGKGSGDDDDDDYGGNGKGGKKGKKGKKTGKKGKKGRGGKKGKKGKGKGGDYGDDDDDDYGTPTSRSPTRSPTTSKNTRPPTLPSPNVLPTPEPTVALTSPPSPAPTVPLTSPPILAPTVAVTPPPTPAPTLPPTPAPITPAPAPTRPPISAPITPAPTPTAPFTSPPTPAPTVTAPLTSPPTPAPTVTLTPAPTPAAPVTIPIPSTPVPTPTPASIREIITRVALQGGAEFDDPNSYQSQALRFLEDVLSPKGELQYIRYYALACIYTASFGVSNKFTDIAFPGEALPGWVSSNRWLSDTGYCGWYGISCSNSFPEKIELNENKMFGIFAPEVQLLAESIKVIDLFDNFFLLAEGDAGNEWISKMVNLEELLVGTTSFEYDGIPTFINEIKGLKEIDFSNTFYTMGPIRGEAFEGLTELNYINLAENFYTTTLPDELVTLPSLEFLYFDNVEFASDIDFTLDFMASMPRIMEFWLDATPVKGGLPTEIGTVMSLASFSAAFCGLTGTIPTEIGNLIFMDRIWLYQNDLTGTIPTQIANLGRLMFLYTEGNQLTGKMPDEVCALSDSSILVSDIGADCNVGNPFFVECACCTCCGEAECGDLETPIS